MSSVLFDAGSLGIALTTAANLSRQDGQCVVLINLRLRAVDYVTSLQKADFGKSDDRSDKQQHQSLE